MINTKEREASMDKYSEEKHLDQQALKSHNSEELSIDLDQKGGRSPISFSNNDNSPTLRK